MDLMIDRTKQPLIKEIDTLQLPEVQTHHLSNGIPVHIVEMGTQEVVKIEMVFKAGRPFERKRLVARSTNSLLKEGSARYSASDLAEELDFYGCTLSTPFSLDTANVVVYSLNKHLPKIMPIVGDLLRQPTFTQRSLDAYRRRSQQQLKIDLTKSDVLAYRKITELIFGDNHPYGYNSVAETYQALKTEDLHAHFKRCYRSTNCQIIISGRVQPDHLPLLDDALGHLQPGEVPLNPLSTNPAPPTALHIPQPDTVQTAVRIGRRLFNRQHPEYLELYVLNTILGGYFSSRLMTNIREDKGYTYNIYSSLDAMLFDGYFYIGTEVSNDLAEATKKEIYKELQTLREERISTEELDMVRSYLFGTFLTMLDGPFNVAETVKTIYTEDLPPTFFEDLVAVTRTITAERLQELAQTYLDPSDMWEVVVGS
jgi:zinc protease